MRVRVLGTFVAASALLVGGLSSPAFAQTVPARVGVAKSTPTWLPKAKNLGKASGQAASSFTLYLAPKGGVAKLQAQVSKVSTPGSASYRKYISTAQYHKAYDPTAASVASVTKWLKANKLRVTEVGAYNAYLQVSGTVAAVQSAFGVTINRYQHDGQQVQANAGALSIPRALSATVLGVTGVDTTPQIMKPAATTPAPPPPSFVNGRPCSIYYGQLAASKQANFVTPLPKFKGKTLPYAVCGYTGPQLRAAYEGATALDGAGVTVAVVDAYAAPTIFADAQQYATSHGDGSYVKGQFTQNNSATYANQAACDPSGWFGEETLDVEAVHAMAPAANIRFYGAKSCFDSDLLKTIAKVVNENKADLVTNSYGDLDESATTGYIAASEAVFLQAALQGISFMFSSGDNGDEVANTGIKQTDYQTSDPYVTSVGGTSAAIDAAGNLAFQAGWGTQKYTLSATGKSWSPLGFLYGAGGGYSSLFNRPTYQDGVVPSTAPPGRAVPDVALDADPNTGFLIGETQTFPNGKVAYGEFRIGGTSLSSPLFAGMTALLLQNAGGRLGFLNPLIYGQAKAKAGTFTDVKGAPKDAGNVRADYANGNDPSGGLLYSVRTFGQDSSLPVTTGWDAVTGVGSPNSAWLTSVKPAQ